VLFWETNTVVTEGETMKGKYELFGLLLVLCLITVCPQLVSAGRRPDAGLPDASMVANESSPFKYLLYAPQNDAGDNLPLVVYLPGGSGKGDDLNLLLDNDGFPKYLAQGLLGDIPAYILIPQLPTDKRGWADMQTSIHELIESVCNNHNIDVDRISLTGHSMGGTGTWALAVAYPDLFSCIAPLSGSVRLSEAAVRALADTPVWAFVGSADSIVDPLPSVRFIERLRLTNPEARITVLDRAGHFVLPRLVYLDRSVDLISWLISQSK
jgi:poly(3-hydroxybutyrate) depolymerase